jgi:cytidine deaminase
MAAPSLTLLTLPAWGTFVPPPAQPPDAATLHPGTLHLPERTVLVDVDLVHELVARARAAALLAYAPFSGFRVGAALVMEDDLGREIITGANVENSSYSLTQCAERTALQTAAARGHRKLRYLAVSCAATTPATPLRDRSLCGSCRQVLREFADANTLVFLDRGTPSPSVDVFDIERLLPHGFHFAR